MPWQPEGLGNPPPSASPRPAPGRRGSEQCPGSAGPAQGGAPAAGVGAPIQPAGGQPGEAAAAGRAGGRAGRGRGCKSLGWQGGGQWLNRLPGKGTGTLRVTGTQASGWCCPWKSSVSWSQPCSSEGTEFSATGTAARGRSAWDPSLLGLPPSGRSGRHGQPRPASGGSSGAMFRLLQDSLSLAPPRQRGRGNSGRRPSAPGHVLGQVRNWVSEGEWPGLGRSSWPRVPSSCPWKGLRGRCLGAGSGQVRLARVVSSGLSRTATRALLTEMHSEPSSRTHCGNARVTMSAVVGARSAVLALPLALSVAPPPISRV